MVKLYSIRHLTWVRPTPNLHSYYQMYQIDQTYRQAAHPKLPGRSRPTLAGWQKCHFGLLPLFSARAYGGRCLCRPSICCSKLDSCSSSSVTVIVTQLWQL